MIRLDAVSEQHLLEYNRTIAQWTRLSGSGDERAAAEYAAGHLKAFGYNTQILVHDAYISLPGPARLRITEPTPREVPCITHSMGISTPEGGVAADLVYVGNGSLEDYARAGAAGKVALVEGRATPQHAVTATRAGVMGLVCISGRTAHEMCCSPVWGSPGRSTVGALPRVHLLSVDRAAGEELRAMCGRGRVTIHVAAEVQTGWTKTPIVLADLVPERPEAEDGRFILFSGHLDSWYVGAMDNGSANATMLEVARLLAPHRDQWRRGLRLALWSGHSHGRYSSSAWYADNFWFDLAEHCLVHVNIDSVGAIDADTFESNSMPETIGLGAWAVREVTVATLAGKRVGRNSDQSFLGIGIPSILGSVSRQADGNLGWWWHTPHDTLDKIDPARLVRDAKIFALAVGRLLTDPVLPFDYHASAVDLRTNLDDLAKAAGQAFDLSPAIAAAHRLEDLCRRLNQEMVGATGARASAINRCLQELGRILIPATYTIAGRYEHDPALETGFLPRLQSARQLATLSPDSDEAKFLLVDLVRGRNAVTVALRAACACVETCLAELGVVF